MNAQAVFKLVADRYQTTPAYLWQRYPDYAVLRHADNQKWYSLVIFSVCCYQGQWPW